MHDNNKNGKSTLLVKLFTFIILGIAQQMLCPQEILFYTMTTGLVISEL